MHKLFPIFSAVLMLLALAGCEQPETPVTLPPATGQLLRVEMGNTYGEQIYVDLEQGKTGAFPNASWDLAFDCGSDHSVFINGGNTALLALGSDTTFRTDVVYANLTWRWDEACGKKDSLAMTNWWLRGDSVFIIDRGQQYKDPERFFQFKIRQDGPDYRLVMADSKGQHVQTHLVKADPSKRLVYFSFADGGQYRNIEPDKNLWDICFLKYRWIYYEFNPPLLYNVAGIYINDERLSVSVDSTSVSFDQVQQGDFDGRIFSSNRDAIGYDWKVPVFKGTDVAYRTRDYVTYFVRKKQSGQNDQLIKLRFLDFYSSTGEKGSPAFELKRLR